MFETENDMFQAERVIYRVQQNRKQGELIWFAGLEKRPHLLPVLVCVYMYVVPMGVPITYVRLKIK